MIIASYSKEREPTNEFDSGRGTVATGSRQLPPLQNYTWYTTWTHHLPNVIIQVWLFSRNACKKIKKKDFRTPTKANNAFEDRSQQRRQPTVVLRLRESKVTPHDKAITLVTFPLQCLHLTLQARLLGLILPGTLTNLLTDDPHRGTENILFVYSFLSCTATLFN